MREIQIEFEIFSFLNMSSVSPDWSWSVCVPRTLYGLRCGRAGHREQDPAYRRLDINYITANTELDLTTISHHRPRDRALNCAKASAASSALRNPVVLRPWDSHAQNMPFRILCTPLYPEEALPARRAEGSSCSPS